MIKGIREEPISAVGHINWGAFHLHVPDYVKVINLPVPLRRAGCHRLPSGRMAEEGQAT